MTHLELATEAIDPDAQQTHATLAAANATMLVANEARVANLIAYFDVLRSSTKLTDDGRLKLAVLEQRIDAALGTDEISTEGAAS